MDEEATAAVATGTGAKSSSSKGGGIMGRSAKIFTRRSLYVDVQSVRPPSPASGGAVNMAASGGHYRTRAATTKAAMTTANGDGDGAGGTNNPVPVFMPADHRLKVLVVGDPGAGRTALVNNLSLPPHLSSPLQRLSSFLGSKSGSSRDRQPDGQKTTTTVQLSQFDSDEILDVTQWHSEGRKMADRRSQLMAGDEQEKKNKKKAKKAKKAKKKKTKAIEDKTSVNDDAGEQQPAEGQQKNEGDNEEKAKKTKKEKKKKKKGEEEEETEEARLRRKRKEKRRSKSMLDLEAFAAEAEEAKKPPSYGVNADLGLKIYNLPIKGQHGFMVSAYDFTHNRLDVCPFFIHERGVILLVYNLETELAQPTIEKWLKLIRQVTYNPTSPGDYLKRTARPPTPNSPRVLVVGTFQDARKCTRDHLVAVQERIQTLSKRFPNIIGSHTVSNTTRKGIPALQEALEVEVVAYGHSVSDWFKHMPVGVLALHDKLRQIRKFGYPPEGEGDDAARNKNDTIVRKKNKSVPVIFFSDLEKFALGYGMNHHQLQSCLRFWNDVGIISYINDPHQRGWYHRGESTSLSSWVFLDRNWLAHLYLRLCQNAREFTPKRGMLVCPERGMALCSHLPSVWPKAMCKEERREIALMYLEKMEMVFYLRPKRMKVLILEENEDDAKKGIATSQNGEAQPSAENSSDGPSVDMATSGTTTATTTTIEAAAATSTEPGDDDHQSGESADVRTEADEVAVAEAVDDGNDQDKTEETKEGDKPQKKEMTPKTARRTPPILANAGWNPPAVDDEAKPRKVVVDAPTTVQQRIFSFDSPTALPSSLLARLVVRFLEVGCKLPLVWRQGMLVIKDDCLALIEGNCPEQDQVTISVYGKQQTAKFIALLEFNFNDSATHWYGLVPTVYIPCVHCLRRGTQPPHLFSLHECEEAVVHGRTWLSCPRQARESQGIKVFLNQLVPDLALAGLERFQIEYAEIQILGDIARGSVSLVKKGLYKGQEVAVKEFVLPDSHDHFSRAEYLKVLQEFRSEVSLLSGLDHENIVRLVGFCKTPLSLVMEYLPEGDLLHFLRERKKNEVDLSTKMTIAVDIARGMYFLHSTSPPIIHRDLKSANILLNNNRAKVTDFGLSTVYSLTTQGRDVDNPLWLAPEVMRGEEASEKADCYSFGVILWEIASHETPYAEYNYSFVTHLEDRIMKEQLRPTMPQDTPWQLANLIRSCWKDAPSERPSFFQIVRRLKQMLGEFEEDEAERRRLKVEYERELNLGASSSFASSSSSSSSSGGGGGVGSSIGVLGKSLLKIGRGLGDHRATADDYHGGGELLSPRGGGGGGGHSHEGEELVLKVNPLMRIRKMTLANITTAADDTSADTQMPPQQQQRASGRPGHRRKFSIGSALGQSEKEKDTITPSGKPL